MSRENVLEIIREAATRRTHVLDLFCNTTDELPPEIRNLKHLRALRAELVGLSALPEELGDIRTLKEIDVRRNRFTEFPKVLEKMDRLQKLDFFGNELSTIPPWIGRLVRLKHLNLGRNQLSSLPEEIGNLTELRFLDVRGNPLEKPPPVGKMLHLRELHLSGPWADFPEGLTELRELRRLSLSGVNARRLPAGFGRLDKLEELVLEDVSLEELPDDLGALRELVHLRVRQAKIRALPPSIGELVKLKTLQINQAQLQSLPSEIGNLTELRKLDLEDNPLTSLPAELKQLGKLRELKLTGHGNTAFDRHGVQHLLGRIATAYFGPVEPTPGTADEYWLRLEDIGWLKNLNPEQRERLRSEISWYFEKYPKAVYLALATGGFDAECIEESDSYDRVLGDYASASSGAFAPEEIRTHASHASERARIAYRLGGQMFHCSVPCESDYFEPGVHDFINETLAKAGYKERFFELPAVDQISHLVFVHPALYQAAVRRGLIPREPPS